MSLGSVNFVRPMPFAAYFKSFRFIGSNGVFKIGILTYDKVLPFMAKLGNPFPLFIGPSNALMSAKVFVDFSIPLVLLASGKPEIGNAIVTGVPVNMINDQIGPISMIDCPYYSTGKVLLSQDTNCDYSVLPDSTGYRAGTHAPTRSSAFKNSRIWVISQERLKGLLAYFRIFDPMHGGASNILVITRFITSFIRVRNGGSPCHIS